MVMSPDKPIIVQSDRTLLLEVLNPYFEAARDSIATFAELIKSPEYIHTYRITPLSLWNAAASGITGEQIVRQLTEYSKYEIPYQIKQDILDYVGRYGLISLIRKNNLLICQATDSNIIKEILGYPSLKKYFTARLDDYSLVVDENARGLLKQEMIKLGFPIKDLAGYQEGEHLAISLLPKSKKGKEFGLRDYQLDAIAAFYAGGSIYGGSGVLVLPCGAGKTIIGLGVLAEIKNEALILTTNTTSVHQWIEELLDKTTLTPEEVGEYTGQNKEVKPVTVATYQILTHRTDREGDFTHMRLFQQRKWGLIIYDEVHLLPAPIFRYTANIQATRRLGLTATLIREDNKEEDVFTLIGPKKYDVPWVEMENKGWIAEANCVEIRLPLAKKSKEEYQLAPRRQKYKIASINPLKLDALKRLLKIHKGDSILIIGQYIEQLTHIAAELRAPLITGRVKQSERERIYEEFKQGKTKVIVVSKVANFAIDLPDAKVAIQVSGTFGSRQEEAQRLGRILRPKADNKAFFYTIISENTIDQEYAMKRQLFLIEQGYQYSIKHEDINSFNFPD